MEGALEQALSGIDLSLNKKESKYRELATLQSFDKQIEADQLKEQQSQLAYQQYEESVNKFSTSLLENDRKKIRQFHDNSKTFLKEQLAMHGGSYKKFMANGGLRVMANYRDSIINSEEAKIYENNAKNMARIIQARDAGKAHLISQKDLFSIEKYETEGGGEITYSGLLTPIEQVDANAFGLGEEIHPKYILKNKNNYSAIMSNYMREYPEKGTPSYQELLEYTQKKYAAVGKNQAAMYANRTSSAKNQESKEKSKYQVFTTAQNALQSINKNANGVNGFSVLDEDYDKYMNRGRKANPRFISNTKFTDVSETEVDSSMNPFTWGNDVNETRPKNAYEFSAFNNSFPKAAKNIYSQYYNPETNKYNIPTSEIYGANGSKLNVDSDTKLSLIPKTVILAPTAKGINPLSGGKNEEEFMVVEFADKKGNVESKQNQEYLKNIKSKDGSPLNVQYRPWQVFEDSEGKLYYKRMPLDNISYQQAFTDAIGEQNDLTETVEAQKTLERVEARKRIEQESKDKFVKQQISNLYNDSNFTHSVYKNIVVKNGLSKNRDIFETMVIGMGRSQKYLNDNFQINNNSLAKISESLGKFLPEESILTLSQENLSFDDAFSAIRKGLLNSADTEAEKEKANVFLDYWKSTYEMKNK